MTYTAQMHNNFRLILNRAEKLNIKYKRQIYNSNIRTSKGLVLVELIVAVIIIGLFTMMAMLNMTGLVGRSSFDKQADQLIGILKMAYNSAMTTGNRYEIVFDFAEQTYILQNLVIDADAADMADSIIETGFFSQDFFLSYVQFDDYEATNEIAAVLRVSKDGFQYGGKIVVLNSQGYPYTILINRIGGSITIAQGDIDMIVPKDKEEIPF